jgi:hypothetical protein
VVKKAADRDKPLIEGAIGCLGSACAQALSNADRSWAARRVFRNFDRVTSGSAPLPSVFAWNQVLDRESLALWHEFMVTHPLEDDERNHVALISFNDGDAPSP